MAMAKTQGNRRPPRTIGGLLVLLAALVWSGAGWADTLCAVVKIEIRQELTLERQAFEARLRINNALDTLAIEDLAVDVTFADEDGNPVLASFDPDNTEAAFFIRIWSMDGVDAVDGTGTVAPSSSADIRWLLIPAPGSGGGVPTGTLYFVGARVRYTLGGEPMQTEITPDFIYVRPLPELTLDYFLTRDVFADDPLTAPIEPIEPFTLGIRVRNNGQAAASDVKVESAQPEIVENEQGLLIDFRIQGSQINGRPATPSLLINLGDVAPGAATTGRWIMTTTLSGQFVDFEAELSHADELGGELTSIIDAVDTHFLIRDVLVDLPGRDAIRDFLAEDGEVKRVYESSGLDTPVTDQSAQAALTPLGADGHSLTLPETAGFVYVQLPDPYSGAKQVAEAQRADGKSIRHENVWFSKRRNRETDRWEYFFNLFDVNSPGGYALTLEDSADAPAPPVLQFIPDRRTAEGSRIGFIVEASDPNGTIPAISAEGLPPGATLTDETDSALATYAFDWSPAPGQAGEWPIRFTATDGELEASQEATLLVCPAASPDCTGVSEPTLPLGTYNETGYGAGFGDGLHPSRVAVTFEANGGDRLLHVQGFDIDSDDEVALYLNGDLLGHLSVGPDDALGPQGLWWLTAAMQVAGENLIELRQNTPGETWGVTRLGLFDVGNAFGHLDSLPGGDQSHADGFELHLPERADGHLLALTTFDADSDGEIAIRLGRAPLIDLPVGADDDWGEDDLLALTAERLDAGDNLLWIHNPIGATQNWGLRLDGLRGIGDPIGSLDAIPAEQRHATEARVLIPAPAANSLLDLQCAAIETDDELAISIANAPAGQCPITAADAWSPSQTLTLSGTGPHILRLQSTANPPAGNPWGVRITDIQADTDNDQVPDPTDNCPSTPNPNQADQDDDDLGNACDTDIDGDLHPNATDNCLRIPNPNQADLDRDGQGDLCDDDVDGDGTPNDQDVFPDDPAETADRDADGTGDRADNCPDDPNPDQANADGDHLGDSCDPLPELCEPCLPSRGGWRAVRP